MSKRIVHASVVAALLVAVFAASPVARAQTRRASVRVVAGLLTYRSAPGAVDTVVPSSTDASGGTADVLLAAANDMRAGAGCERAEGPPGLPFAVTCTGVVSATFLLGGGNDVLGLDSGSVPRLVRSGPGDDRVFGGAGHDVLLGGAGDDMVSAGVGNDDASGGIGDDRVDVQLRRGDAFTGATLFGGAGRDNVVGGSVEYGGPGNDTLAGNELVGSGGDDVLIGIGATSRLAGGSGADTFEGLGVHDVLDYSDRTADVSVTDDGVANDGAPGEGDNVKPGVAPKWAIEVVQTGSGDDTVSMHGVHTPRIFGGSGEDSLSLDGGPGAVFGGPGADVLTISGAPGRLRGDTGDDQLTSSDASPDRDGCGPGHDEVTADTIDIVNANCENVTTG